MGDKLDDIFALQKRLDDRIISDRNIEKSRDEWVRDLTIAMEDEDTGGAIKGNRIDILFANHSDAVNFGRQNVEVRKISE